MILPFEVYWIWGEVSSIYFQLLRCEELFSVLTVIFMAGVRRVEAGLSDRQAQRPFLDALQVDKVVPTDKSRTERVFSHNNTELIFVGSE
jgi:hypothetical protein